MGGEKGTVRTPYRRTRKRSWSWFWGVLSWVKSMWSLLRELFRIESRPILKYTECHSKIAFGSIHLGRRTTAHNMGKIQLRFENTSRDSRYSERSRVPATLTVLQQCTVLASPSEEGFDSNGSTLSAGTDPHQLRGSVASTCCLLSSFCLPLVV